MPRGRGEEFGDPIWHEVTKHLRRIILAATRKYSVQRAPLCPANAP
jgi:hypothetical protein